MNRIYRVVWSKALHTWVVASELARTRGKRGGGNPPAVTRSLARVHSAPATPGLLRSAILVAIAAFASPALAEDKHWDANGTAVGQGDDGTWDLVSVLWNDSADGVSGPYNAWNNAALDHAIFGGTAGIVTLADPITVGDITFNTNGYTLTGGTLTLGGTTPTITVNSGTATIDSNVAGTAGLAKAGAGTLVLQGANTFSGGITLGGGTLWADSDAALGASGSDITTTATATFRVDAGSIDRTVTIGAGTTLTLAGAATGSALYAGEGNVFVTNGVTLNNDASTYTGTTRFQGANQGIANIFFTSVRNLGEASSLGAPTTVAEGTITFAGGTQYSDRVIYIGTGDSSNRNWVMGGSTLRRLMNQGTGTLEITGDIAMPNATSFEAFTAGFALLGELSGDADAIFFNASADGPITVGGGANTYTGMTSIAGGIVSATVLADGGEASSLGAGSVINLDDAGTLRYTGTGDSSDRTWASNGATGINNDGTGSLTLSGALSFLPDNPAVDSLTFGGTFAGTSVFAGEISGEGDLLSTGSTTWELSGANTRTGAVVVDGGTLRAGSASAFGTVTGVTVNGGALDLNGFDLVTPELSGTGGAVALGGANLAVDTALGTSSAYGGSITGNGGLTKLGAGTLTLSGASTYTGATTVSGGVLALDFGADGAPVENIIGSASTLNMEGGTLNVIGADGIANTQTFNGLNVTAGNNDIDASSGAGGSMTLDLGTITRTGGLVNFNLPDSGSITTDNADTALSWATVNGADYAKVEGGVIVAFDDTDYTNKDDASTWQGGEFISDTAGAADTPYFGTVSTDVQLGGLRYTAAADSTVTVAGGNTLGVDGTVIVAPSVDTNSVTITGGFVTGTLGGGVLGIRQNSAGDFTIESQVVDNGGDAIGIAKTGAGLVTLANAANTYTGATTVSEGTLSVGNIGDGGAASSIGASSADAANLVLQGGTLRYTGGTMTSDRGFTVARSGDILNGTIEVAQAGANLTFTGEAVSPDGAGLVKTGAGTLTLANAANRYDGATTVAGGTLSVTTLANGGVDSAIGASSSAAGNLVLADGGMLQYTGATVESDRGFTVDTGGGGIDVADANATLTLSGTAVGEGRLTKDGAGTLVLSGTNTYSGGTLVADGILRAGSTEAFGHVDRLMTVEAGATLDLDGHHNQVGALAGDGTVTLGTATLTTGTINGTFSGTIAGDGGLTKVGSGTQALSGCNNVYDGVTSITGGTLSVDCLADGGSASGIGASTSDAANVVFSGGRLRYTAVGTATSVDRGFTLQSSRGFIDVTDAATTLEFTGNVVGGGVLRKEGAGTLVLSGANTYTNTTEITGGTLRAGSTTAFGGTGRVNFGNTAGVVLDLDGFDNTVTALMGGGANGGDVELGGATLTIDHGANQTYAGAIRGAGGLDKTGNGLQRLHGTDSSYTGRTTIGGGTLEVMSLADGGLNSSIGASTADAANLVIDGAVLRYVGAGHDTNREFTLGANGATLDASGTGAVRFTSAAAITFAGTDTARMLTLTGASADDNALAAQITDNGTGATALTKTGDGTWVLTNTDNDYTGVTTISGGVLAVDKLSDGGVASSLGASTADAANLVIGNNSTLRYTGTGDTTDRLFTLSEGVTFLESSGSGAIVFTDTGPVTLAGNGAHVIALGGSNADANTLAGSIGDAALGLTSLAKNDGGTWHLTGDNTFTGNTNINGGTLYIGDGGTTGSIASTEVNNFGTLGFDRSDTLTYGGLVQGTGDVLQAGAGTTILTGDNTYTGTTTVSAGTLVIDGDQSSATGLTTVEGGATLGGSGTLGGNVVVTGGTLAPGNSPGTLTINGDLALDAASILDFELGAANVVGGPLNDLIEVGGDLVLDGTIDVTVSGGGSFDAGLYRVVNYGGSLTDNVLEPGTMPPDGEVFVLTSIANQVSLVNTAGLTLNLWDGDGGPKFDGTINGGDGTWQDGTGNDNWTEESGSINVAYTDGAFAVFSSTPGTVTVDAGGVTASGMQFASDGYLVTGSTIELVDPQGAIRVGDGTAAGAGYEATIASALTGAAELVKTDLGTLILTGANSYSGGTRIQSGTLRVSTDASLGDFAGGLTFEGGMLNTTATFGSARAVTLAGDGTFDAEAGTTLTLSGLVSGAGGLVKEGAGTLVLTGNDTYSGGTTISAGTLQIGNGGAAGSLAGDVTNDGLLVFDRSDALAFDGTISGTGGLVHAGSGVLILTGNNGYTGLTTVAAGTLQVGDGGTTGAIGGDVVNDGTLQFARAGALGYAGAITGSGSLSQAGEGVLTLTGTSAYTGDTSISAGELRLASGGAITGTAATSVDGTETALTVSGPGSILETGRLAVATTVDGTAMLNIESGGVVRTTDNAATALGSSSARSAVVDIDGAGSRLDLAGSLDLDNGSLSILGGGAASAASLAMSRGLGASVLVSGAGSGLSIAGDAVAATDLGSADGTAIITLAAGGTLNVGGELVLAEGAGSTGILNIGGSEGATAAAAGVLDAAQLGFGPGAGRVIFNHLDTGYTFSAAMVGGGTLNHLAGVTALTGDSSLFSGAASVSGGTLLVNGTLGDGTIAVDVLSGGTLGGTGTIGGSVTVADGVLAPGESPGTLTIAGDLLLDAGARLEFEFGEANFPGGPLNDLVEIGGDLVLDGTLDVTVTPGGSFTAGLYRIFDYGGALTDGGLDVGAVPAGSAVFVQTAVPGQVNLVNTAGLSLNFWDGSATPRNDGIVQGGNGTWRLGGGANDWTTHDGALNADYAQDSFAILMGSSGTIAVDDSGGDVGISGMQFASDGYLVTGDALALNGANATIRVGDGTAAGAAMTATIESVLTGSARLVKEDAGTLVLAGANSHAGGTAVTGGTLEVASDASLGDAAGALLLDGGNLHTTATFASTRDVLLEGTGTLVTDAGTTLTLNGAVSGAGSLTKEGAGTLVLASDNAYTGGTTILDGILQVGAGGADGSIAGDVANDGLLRFNRSGTLAFAGTISGTGALDHAGSGTTVLTADNAYAGATSVSGGALLIDGNQAAATGTTTVASGATIGGAGTIGGDLVVTDGGTLAPGSMDVGTLTVNGALSLTGGARLEYEFGQSNVVGGPLNDLVVVGGDLVLDGTIDVSVSPGGSFDVGLYRIVSYAGALVDAGLQAGTLPPGSDAEIQTAIANQVNLVNTTGLVLGFWDGEAGPKLDGAVNGGDGTWQAGGNDNWTETGGTVNASWTNETFAVFSAAAGTVTVDDGLGAVTATGMQFASDGYAVTGDALQLTGTRSTVRVGDGTAAGADMTATVQSALTGTGELVKTDLGTLVLTGTNDWSGDTTIEAGTLLVNGTHSAAGGLVSVLSGGTLGGTGTIGGDVQVADGATLAPGDGPGTLAIAGDLRLGDDSVLAFELGEADVVGGALNDLVEVGGDLTLDGTLNVTTPVGSFDAGVYRLFNYAGTLTDNGLELGSLPPGANAFVQTAVANQVSLVNTAGAGLNFWDGAAGTANDGRVEGGDGVWRLSGDDWTSAAGSLNGPYLNGAFAVFTGAAGTVTIDDADGAVTAAGLQFAVDGYVLEGDALTLAGAPTLIRVGDGTDAGANMTATIRSVLAGGAALEKTDAGTLVLAGDNGYTGGTTIREGVLQLGDGGSTGSITGDVVNDGVLAFNRADVFTFDGVVSGGGSLQQVGSGTTVLTGMHTYVGGTSILAGTLQVDGSLAGETTIGGSATLAGTGTLGSVTAETGSYLSPGNAATPFGTLTLAGDYAGSGTVVIHTALGDETSATSRLVIEGDTAEASSPVLVRNVGGSGAQTSGDGIVVIEVHGTSPADSFHLAEAVQAGAYEYLLYQGGASDANDWFLRSELIDPTGNVDPPEPVPSWRPGAAGYVLGPHASLEYGFTALGNLRARVGAQGRVSDANRAPADAWMRVYTHGLEIAGERFEAGDVRMTTVQFGTDLLRLDGGNGSTHFGVMASVGESSAAFFDPERAIAGLETRAGELEMNVAGGGLYWTRHAAGGAYLDVSAQLLGYRNRYRDQYSAVGRQDGWGGTVAAEVGVPLALGASKWHVEPQLRLAWQRLDLDGFSDDVSAVSEVTEDGLRGRAGLQLFRAPSDWLGMRGASPYVGVGVQKDFRDAGGITVGATSLHEVLPDTTGDLSLGLTGSLRNGVELHFDLRYQQATDGERDGVRGNFGFRVRF